MKLRWEKREYRWLQKSVKQERKQTLVLAGFTRKICIYTKTHTRIKKMNERERKFSYKANRLLHSSYRPSHCVGRLYQNNGKDSQQYNYNACSSNNAVTSRSECSRGVPSLSHPQFILIHYVRHRVISSPFFYFCGIYPTVIFNSYIQVDRLSSIYPTRSFSKKSFYTCITMQFIFLTLVKTNFYRN